MAQAKGEQWQRQANHFQHIIQDMEQVANDENSTAEEQTEARETITDMQANLERLLDKHDVKPTV